MAKIPTEPVYQLIDEVTDGTIVYGTPQPYNNYPNLQLKQLGDRTDANRGLIQGVQIAFSGEAATVSSIEGGTDQVIDLDTLFTPQLGATLTYEVTYNSDNNKVTTSIAGNLMTIGFPIWTEEVTVRVANVTLHVTAKASTGSRATIAIRVKVTNLTSIFTTFYYGMNYLAADGPAAIYVDAVERTNILNDPNLNTVFGNAFAGNPVFRVPTDVGTIPAKALSQNIIVPVTRFRYIGGALEGSYLYTIEPETSTVDPLDFQNEGIAFYAFNPTNAPNRSQLLRRYRWEGRQPLGDYVYGLRFVPPAASGIFTEGDLCRVFEIE